MQRTVKWLMAVVMLLLIGTTPVDRFWVLDTGLTWWQTHHGDLMAVTSTDDPAYGELPLLRPDTPAADHFPVPPPFVQATERGPRIVLGSLYPRLNGLFDAAFGDWGVRLLMLLWVVLLWWGLRRLQADNLLALLLLWSTPLLFYALQLWSHFAAASVVLLALSFLQLPLVAGLLLMLATLLRLEAGVVLLVLLLYWLFRRQWRSLLMLLVTAVPAGVAWLLWNYQTLGQWLPLQLTANLGNPETGWSPLALLTRFEYLLLPLRSYPLLGVAVIVGLTGTVTAHSRAGKVLLGLYGLHTLWLAGSFFTDPHIQNHLGLYTSLLATAPLLVMAFRPLSRSQEAEMSGAVSDPDSRTLQHLFWLSLGLIILLLPTYTGFHWGARWLIVLVPVAAVVAARNWQAGGNRRLFFLLLIGSLLLQAGSVQLLRERQELQGQFLHRLQEANCRFILTDIPFLAGNMPQLQLRHDILLVDDMSDIPLLVQVLRGAEVDSFLLVHYHDIRFDRQLHALGLPVELVEVVSMPAGSRGEEPWVALKFRFRETGSVQQRGDSF